MPIVSARPHNVLCTVRFILQSVLHRSQQIRNGHLSRYHRMAVCAGPKLLPDHVVDGGFGNAILFTQHLDVRPVKLLLNHTINLQLDHLTHLRNVNSVPSKHFHQLQEYGNSHALRYLSGLLLQVFQGDVG